MRTISTKDLKRKLHEEPYFVYGLGKASRRFIDAIDHPDCKENFRGFIVSKADKEDGKDVYELNSISDKNMLIFIATHCVNANEIENTLDEKKFKNFYWVYPNIFELELGDDPIQSDCKIQLRELVGGLGNRNKIQLACYLHFIEGVVAGDEKEKSYYIRLHSLFTGDDTVKRKTVLFEKEIENARKGIFDSHPILISQSGLVIDGFHRTSLAYYFGSKTIKANIYRDSSCANCIRIIDSISIKSVSNVDMKIIDIVAQRAGKKIS